MDNRGGTKVRGEFDLSMAALHTEKELDLAESTLRSKVEPIQGDNRTHVTVHFGLGISTPRQLHDIVTAMGFSILVDDSPAGAAPQKVTYPSATVRGDSTQPTVICTWSVSPEEKASVQLNPRKRTVSIKAKKSVMLHHAELIVTFFGVPMLVTAPGPERRAKAKHPAAPMAEESGSSIRAHLRGRAARSD